jgi:alpha-N-arabinofuranosidase
MDRTQIVIHRDYQIGAVDPRIFGGFLEHIGRAVYEGVYDPQPP